MTDRTNDSSVRWCRIGALGLLLILAALAVLLGIRFLRDQPVTYDDPVDHFKYGSTGGERNLGFPYWVWRWAPCCHWLQPLVDTSPGTGSSGSGPSPIG